MLAEARRGGEIRRRGLTAWRGRGMIAAGREPVPERVPADHP
jgi:hypothetical protein